MFIGEFHYNIDSKARLAIPAKYRQYFSEGAVVTRGLDRTLFLFPKEEWNKLAQRIAQLPLAKANTRAFARLMLAGAFSVELDRQGRIVLPEYLRDYAQLKKKVVIAGVYNRLEIWDEALWEEYKKDTEKSSTEIAETLGELGV